MSQISLTQALDLSSCLSHDGTLSISNDICFGQTALGGYIIALLHKVALRYAAQHPVMRHQLDVQSSTSHFFRPVFPAQGPYMVKVHEVNVGRTWSLLRAEIFHVNNSKLYATVDCSLTNLEVLGRSLDTRWELYPSPPHNNFVKTNSDHAVDQPDSRWACYHTAFLPDGFRRAHAYIKYFIPMSYSPTQSFDEQWVVPGWDCFPTGSRDPALPEARWTTDMLPFVVELNPPSQENYFPHEDSMPLPVGSTRSTLEFAQRQKAARVEEQRANWRELGKGVNGDGSAPDGFKLFIARKNMVSTTISMTLEIKKRLPPEGVRWLYLRGEMKRIKNGSMDWQVLCFDEDMDLVAIRNSVEHLLEPVGKNQRETSKRHNKGSDPQSNL